MIVHIPKVAVHPELASEYEACAAGFEQRSERTWSIDDQSERYLALVEKLKKIRRIENFAKMTAPPSTTATPQPRECSIDTGARTATRLAICQACPHLVGVGLRHLSVLFPKQQRRCSCPNGEVSLVSGRCPQQPARWL